MRNMVNTTLDGRADDQVPKGEAYGCFPLFGKGGPGGIFVLLLFLFQLFQPSGHALAEDFKLFSQGRAFVSPLVEKESADIEWFRKETGISSKYTDRESGVMGLAWSHFLAMVFLIFSIMVVVVAVILRYRRTKELLALMLKEGSRNDGGG